MRRPNITGNIPHVFQTPGIRRMIDDMIRRRVVRGERQSNLASSPPMNQLTLAFFLPASCHVSSSLYICTTHSLLPTKLQKFASLSSRSRPPSMVRLPSTP